MNMDPMNVILSLLVEDEYGMWEVLWRVKSVDPSLSDEAALSISMETLGMLTRDGMAVLVRKDEGGEIQIAPDLVAGVLEDPESWRPPLQFDVGVYVLATSKGELAYSRG